MRRALVPLLLIAILLIPASAVARQRIRVDDDYFKRAGSPPTIHVSKGERVIWRFRGDSLHNVHVTSGPRQFTSPLKRDGRYRKRMRKRGTYKIVCTVHAPDMAMTLKVG
jgi:plastocyanin